MQRRTPVLIVTSARPRVGKTLLARALTEFFPAQRRAVAAFDVNPDDFKLADYLPEFAIPADVTETRGEVALFDQLILADEVPKVVDLSHLQFGRFFSVMRDIDFAAAAWRGGIAPMVLFVADADERSRVSYEMLSDRFTGLPLVPVFNDNLPHFEAYRDKFPPTPNGGEPIRIPKLTSVVRSVVDRPGFSFISYVMKNGDPTAELYQWLRGLFVTFREIEVRLLLGELQPQLRRIA